MFVGRPPGTTLRRAREAAYLPEGSGTERFDPDFPTALKCHACGKFCFGPRKHLSEAMREHLDTVCPARHRTADEPQVMTVLFPRT